MDKYVKRSDLIGAEIIEVDGTEEEYYTIKLKLKSGIAAELDAEHGSSLVCFREMTNEEVLQWEVAGKNEEIEKLREANYQLTKANAELMKKLAK